MALLVSAIWGGNFAAAKLALGHFPPFLLTGLRFGIVAALLLPFVPRPHGKLREIFGLSIVLGTLHFGLVFGGMSRGLDVATTVIGTQLGVPFSCILGAVMMKDPLGPRRLLGLAIAFCGVALVAGTPSVLDAGSAFAMVVAGALAWGYSNIQIKKMGEVNILSMVAWLALFTLPQMLSLSLLFEHPPLEVVLGAGWQEIAAVMFTALFSTIVAYSLWYYLLARYPVSHVAPFSLLVPCFGIASGIVMFGEHLTLQMAVGGAVTVLGVAIITIRRPFLAVWDRL